MPTRVRPLSSGSVLSAVAAMVGLRCGLRRVDPLSHAVTATLGVESIGVVLGASSWLNDLSQMSPMITLGSGRCTARRGNAATRVGERVRETSRHTDDLVTTYSRPKGLRSAGPTR